MEYLKTSNSIQKNTFETCLQPVNYWSKKQGAPFHMSFGQLSYNSHLTFCYTITWSSMHTFPACKNRRQIIICIFIVCADESLHLSLSLPKLTLHPTPSETRTCRHKQSSKAVKPDHVPVSVSSVQPVTTGIDVLWPVSCLHSAMLARD